MNSSTKPESFMFDTEFTTDGHVVSSGESAFKRYRQDEVDALCEAARQEGIASVQAETERRIAASAEAIAQHLSPVLPFATNLADQTRREAGELALLMARHLAGAALAHVPEEAIKATLGETLSYLPNGLKLILSVHPDVSERIEAAIRPRLPSESELIVEPDPQAAPGAWRLHWESGGFSHNPEELTAQLERILDDHLNQPVDEQGDLFADIA